MAYASVDDLAAKWGSTLVNLLAWDDSIQAVNNDRIAAALANASATIDSYLARRYALPVAPQADTAALLTDLCCDLAASKLAVTPGARNDIIVDADKRAMALLRDIADGKAALNLVPATAEPPISPGEAVMIADDRQFSRNRLRGL